MTDDEKEAIKSEVMRRMDDYTLAFLKGTREDAQAFVKLPVAYVAESEVQMHERYPFDPVTLRQESGLHHLDGPIEVIHVSSTKAHVLIEAMRKRADDSSIEALRSIYIWQRHDVNSQWLITVFSGIKEKLH